MAPFNFVLGKVARSPMTLAVRYSSLIFKPRSVSAMNPVPAEVSRMDNGCRVATEALGGSLCTVGVYINGGSRYERADEDGSSNVMRRLFFEGTTKRTGPQLGRELSKLTGMADSYNDRETAGIYMVCMPDDVEAAVSLLSEMVIHPDFSKTPFGHAQRGAISDLQAHVGDPWEILQFYLHANAYAGTELAKGPNGSMKVLRQLTPDTVAQFHRNVVVGENVVLAAVGDVDHERLHDLSEKYFGDLPTNHVGEIPELLPCRYTSGKMSHREDSWPYMYGISAVEAPGWENVNEMINMMVANCIIGQWDRAITPYAASPHRLPHRLGPQGTTRLFSNFYIPYYRTGLWGTYTVHDESREAFDECRREMTREWKYLCGSLQESDLELGKQMLRVQVMESEETGPQAVDSLGKQVLRYGHKYGTNEILRMIDNVSADSCSSVAEDYIYDREPVYVAFGKCFHYENFSWNTMKRGLGWYFS